MNSGREEKILAALLAAPTVREAAITSGIPERTVYKYLARPDFRAEYQRQRTELVLSLIHIWVFACSKSAFDHNFDHN